MISCIRTLGLYPGANAASKIPLSQSFSSQCVPLDCSNQLEICTRHHENALHPAARDPPSARTKRSSCRRIAKFSSSRCCSTWQAQLHGCSGPVHAFSKHVHGTRPLQVSGAIYIAKEIVTSVRGKLALSRQDRSTKADRSTQRVSSA